MRVYLPATLPLLRAALAAGEVGPAPLWAFAVTPALREWYAEGGDEELEYAAQTEAARASLRLLDEALVLDHDTPARRLVLAADVPDDWVAGHPDLERAVVRLDRPVPVSLLVAAHVDEQEAEATVSVAAESVVAAELGSADAQFAVDEAEGFELLWYDAAELALLALAPPADPQRE